MRKHARHYRGNSNWNSMELVGFLRWGGYSRPLPPPLSLHRCFTRRKSIGPLFFALFISRAQCFDYEWGHEEEKKREEWERGGERTIGYTYSRFARRDQPGNKLAREKAKRRRGSESSGGKTDVAGANRLNIFQPGRNGGLELAMSGKSRTPTCSLRFWFRIITRNRRVCFPIPSNNREILVRVYQREDNLITRVSHRFSISRDTYTVLERSLMY